MPSARGRNPQHASNYARQQRATGIPGLGFIAGSLWRQGNRLAGRKRYSPMCGSDGGDRSRPSFPTIARHCLRTAGSVDGEKVKNARVRGYASNALLPRLNRVWLSTESCYRIPCRYEARFPNLRCVSCRLISIECFSGESQPAESVWHACNARDLPHRTWRSNRVR